MVVLHGVDLCLSSSEGPSSDLLQHSFQGPVDSEFETGRFPVVHSSVP